MNIPEVVYYLRNSERVILLKGEYASIVCNYDTETLALEGRPYIDFVAWYEHDGLMYESENHKPLDGGFNQYEALAAATEMLHCIAALEEYLKQ